MMPCMNAAAGRMSLGGRRPGVLRNAPDARLAGFDVVMTHFRAENQKENKRQ